MSPAEQCAKKVTHRSRRDAKRAALRAQSQGKGARRAYRCPECSFWHVTHFTKTEYTRRLEAVA